MGKVAGLSAIGDTGFCPAGAVSWKRWLERGAAVTVVLVVSAGPILLGERRSAHPARSDVILAGDDWAASAQVSLEGAVTPHVPEVVAP
jgi:hypothetical protein